LIGRLSIPRLNVRSVVREGAGKDTLEVALGHIPGTALPGQAGNTGIAGHRDTLFRGLRNVRRDDVIDFQTPNADYKYQVESTYIVKPSDVGVLKPAQYSEMTLVTCYPFYYVGSAPDRFIVKARLLDPPAVAVTPTVQRSVPAVKSAVRPVVRAAAKPAATKVRFQVSENESRQIVPGVWLGLSGADPVQHRASIWLYTTPERRTISLRNQPADEAVLFHGTSDTQQRELMITRVTANAVTGYLLVFP
jgi:sortase A